MLVASNAHPRRRRSASVGWSRAALTVRIAVFAIPRRWHENISTAVEVSGDTVECAEEVCSMVEPAPARGDADVAAIGALLGDEGRCRVLMALNDGRALPASVLAAEAEVSPSTASSHLRKLVDAGLLAVEAHGRNRYYRLASPQVGQMLEALTQLAPAKPIRSLRQGTRAHALRQARTCYDHLAGRLGVELMLAMIERGHLDGGDGTFDPATADRDGRQGHGHDVDYRLTAEGRLFLDEFGVGLPARRPAVRYCIDWSEQRHHLAGALGRGLRDRLSDLGWIHRSKTSRAVQVTPAGHDGLRDVFRIAIEQ
jgi:DNA-binding transcriptional ArsR family regulator